MPTPSPAPPSSRPRWGLLPVLVWLMVVILVGTLLLTGALF